MGIYLDKEWPELSAAFRLVPWFPGPGNEPKSVWEFRLGKELISWEKYQLSTPPVPEAAEDTNFVYPNSKDEGRKRKGLILCTSDYCYNIDICDKLTKIEVTGTRNLEGMRERRKETEYIRQVP